MPLTESQSRYVNFYTDFAFKKLFGTEANKDLLLSFLNSEGKEAIFNRLFEIAEIAKYPPEERLDYEESLKNFRDWYSCLQTAERKGRKEGLAEGLEKGLAEGLEKGLEKGRLKERQANIARMRQKGYDDATIADILDITIKDVAGN